MGIKQDGSKKIISFKLARSDESQSEWDGLINDAIYRGLHLPPYAFIVHDDSPGISSATDFASPFQKKQLCFFHYIQTVSSKTNKQYQKKQIQKDLSFVYDSSINQKIAIASFNNFIKKWFKINPSLALYVKNTFLSTLLYLEYPKHMHHWLSTTNYIGRAFKEINRKTYDVSIFPNCSSAERIFFANYGV